MEKIAGVKLSIEGEEILKMNHPSILVGNHQHNIDVLSIAKVFTKHTVVLGKSQIALIPFFGQIYVLCGNILIKRGSRKQVVKSMNELEKRVIEDRLSVLIFPEGHRNTGDTLLPFKKGAFHTAIKTQSPIIAFSVSQFVKKNELNKLGMANIRIKVHPPIQTIGLTNKDIPALMKNSKTLIEDGIRSLN